MGRKIPGKKHRGVKNPHEQQLVRKESIKNKINSPPVDIDDQPIPESLKRLAQWKKLGRKELKKRKQDRKKALKSWLDGEPEAIQRETTGSVKSSPALKRPGESEKEFLDRTYKETSKEMIQQSKKSLLVPDDPGKSGKKKKGDVAQIILNASGKQKLKKKEAPNDEEHVSKKERVKLLLAAKKQAKMEKLQELQDEKDLFRDTVEFGEVVHAPPVLSLPARNKTKIGDAKLGHRKLILNTLMSTNHHQRGKQNTTKKMKNMTPEERAVLETIRLEAVEVYRRLKAKKPLKGVLTST